MSSADVRNVREGTSSGDAELQYRPRFLTVKAAIVCLLMLRILAQSTSALGAVHCVRSLGGDPCLSTITGALAIAEPGDTVRVAAGDYVENILVTKNIDLEGGWNASFTTREPSVFISTIRPSHPSESVVTLLGNFSDPSQSTPLFTGFTVTGGRADLGFNHGGGITSFSSNAVIRGNRIVGNRAYFLGGGIWVQRGAPRIEDNEILENFVTAAEGGGGVMLEGASGTTLLRNRIEGNSTDGGSGGGILVSSSSSVRMRGNIIAANRVLPDGRSNSGGGVRFSASDALMNGDLVSDNVVGLAECVGSGGGVSIRASTVRLQAVRILRNCAATGGGISIEQGSTQSYVVSNTLIAGNIAGGVSIGINSPGRISNVTLVGGRVGVGVSVGTNSALTLENTIVTRFGIAITGNRVLERSNDFFDNFSISDPNPDSDPDPPDPNENFFVDPLLDPNYRLTAGSPMIDAGVATPPPFLDVDGELRPTDGGSGRYRMDIGAAEFPGDPQLNIDLEADEVDLRIDGPGAPRENPNAGGNTDQIGYAVLAHDISGDGRDDLILSAQDFKPAGDDAVFQATGRLFGMFNFMERRTGIIDLFTEAPDLTVDSRIRNEHMGEELAAGDLNGDQIPDLVIGAGFQDDADPNVVSRVFVLFGDESLSGIVPINSASPGDYNLIGQNETTSQIGGSGSLAVGDVSGDGIADLVAGDHTAMDPNAADGAIINAGAIHVVFGRRLLSGTQNLAIAPADFTLYGPSTASLLRSVALGQLNADDELDLVGRSLTQAHVVFGPVQPGELHLSTDQPDVTISGLQPSNTNFGADVFIADLTGDGRDDLIVRSGSLVYVFEGPLSTGAILSPLDAAITLSNVDAVAFERADVFGDSRLDLMIASGTLKMNAFVLSPGIPRGTIAPVQELASVVFHGNQERRKWDVGAGDLDDDGQDDMIVSYFPRVDPDALNDDEGRTYVTYGGGQLDNCPGRFNPDQADLDEDRVGDPCDNCALAANSEQRDRGGSFTLLSDGIGDVCQCGDVTDDGVADLADLEAIRQALVGIRSGELRSERCNVLGGLDSTIEERGLPRDCNMADVAVMARQATGRLPQLEQACLPAISLP